MRGEVITAYGRELKTATRQGWNRFWFSPADPATLGLIRILSGLMLFYTHLVWSIDLLDFFGPDGWLTASAVAHWHGAQSIGDTWAPSLFWWIQTPAAVWISHVAGLVVFALFTVGLWTRVTGPLAFVVTLSYIHRMPGALFGLDQINGMLALYLAIGPSGAAFSLDRWRFRRRGVHAPTVQASVWANLSIRLIQVHMCVIYFFAGASKLSGNSWWDGTAMWISLANAEYQTLDLTWLAAWPRTINLLTLLTVLWELSFCALVWPRLVRPLVLALAVFVHLGIGIAFGMMTFGLVMLIGCCAFVPPSLVRRCCSYQPAWKPDA